MGRYYVVLDGTRSGVLCVIAEVVREPNDDGRDRELSLAGNLAGSQAAILTEEELRALPGGRIAIQRWRSGNDNSFALDTLAHDLEEASMQKRTEPSPAMSLEEARLLVEHSRRRAREVLAEVGAVREQSRSIRDALRVTIEKVQRERAKTDSLLQAIGGQMGKQIQPGKRRHLRSVS